MNGARWLLVVAAGCGPRVPLSEVPIVGGTPEARSAASEELARFDAWVGQGRLRIAEVRFVSSLADEFEDTNPVGHWDQRAGIVEIEETLPVSRVDTVLRHELCHALDSAEDLSKDVPLFERLGAGYPRVEGAAAEALAELCATGPFVAAIVNASSCDPQDSPDLVEGFGWVAGTVWSNFAPADPAGAVGPAVASFAYRDDHPDWAVEGGLLAPTDDPDRIQVRVSVRDVGLTEFQVELATGEPVAPGQELAQTLPNEDDPPPGLPTDDVPVYWSFGWPDGPAAAIVEPRVDQQSLTPRLVVSDGKDWRPVADGCASIEFGVFTAQGRVWHTWDDGEAIHWAPLKVRSGG